MPFYFPASPHDRRHGPEGYDRYQSYKDWLRDEFTFRCVYCLERERWYPSGSDAFGVDHVFPKGNEQYTHLALSYSNLVYACNRCNSAKRDEILLNPCTVAFAEHLRVDPDGEIVGISDEGSLVINILGLDLRDLTEERKNKFRIVNLYERYPADDEVRELYEREFGFPDALPNLNRLEPPFNSKPEGIGQSYFELRAAGALPRIYGC